MGLQIGRRSTLPAKVSSTAQRAMGPDLPPLTPTSSSVTRAQQGWATPAHHLGEVPGPQMVT